jgi:outer membrane protein assembly factor BamB
LNVGLDGKLYALTSGGSPVKVYDPVSLAFLRDIPVPATIIWRAGRSIAVDQNGRVFTCGSDGTVYRLSPNGALEASMATGFTSLMDIDVDESGRLIIGQTGGHVIIGDSEFLNKFASFLVVDNPTAPGSVFVSFARPLSNRGSPMSPRPSASSSPTPSPKATAVALHGKNSLVRTGRH